MRNLCLNPDRLEVARRVGMSEAGVTIGFRLSFYDDDDSVDLMIGYETMLYLLTGLTKALNET